MMGFRGANNSSATSITVANPPAGVNAVYKSNNMELSRYINKKQNG